MSAILTSRWGWVVPALLGLLLTVGLIWAHFTGGRVRGVHGAGGTPSASPVFHHDGHGRGR